VTVKPKTGDAVALTVTDRTELEVWGIEPATFADLKVGQWVRAEYNATTEEAYQIEVKGKGQPSVAVRQGFFGTVKEKADASLTLDTKQGVVVLALDANTQYWVPPKKDATLADVNVGDRVAVLAEKQQDGSLLAKRVLVIPARPEPLRLQVTAVVTKVEGNTVTLTKDGQTYTVELPAALAAKVQVGDVITIALLRTAGVETYVGSALMKSEELRDRLQSLADKVKASRPQNSDGQSKQTRDLQKVTSLLQQNLEEHQEQLNNVIQKVTPQAKDALQKAAENARKGWEQSIASAQKDKTPTSTPTAIRGK